MKVHNTLSGQKEEFLPPGSEVRMYVCGVTPYDDSHIGHAMSYIIFDVIRRYLRYRGYKVRYVQNITDIDDKIIARANKLGISAGELAEKFINSFFQDMASLNIERADVYPRATEEIPKIIEIVEGLVAKGHAYPVQGSVYFRVRSDADYGKLAHRTLEPMMAGARIEPGEEKEHPMDFALWKAVKPGEPSWPSPWGPGRPGWHIECSAMSLKYLGNQLDIHGGGQDLIFPHHQNELAQSESFTGVKPFVKYWLHNGLLQFGEEKMSKSLGNLVTIKDALRKYSADAIRIFILSSHYRSPLTYSEAALEAAQRGAERLRQAAQMQGKTQIYGERVIKPYRQRFIDAMDDDFNSAQALAALFDLSREINRETDEGHTIIGAQRMFLDMASVLGLTLTIPEELSFEAKLYKEVQDLHQNNNITELRDKLKDSLKQLEKDWDAYNSMLVSLNKQLIQDAGSRPYFEKIKADWSALGRSNGVYWDTLAALRDRLAKDDRKDSDETLAALEKLSESSVSSIAAAIAIRNKLREAKQFKLADEIRNKLAELNIVLEDASGGTTWKYKR
ncbi:MAG: cysteine--tRNA ligase [Chloroflexota bacterium]|nr:cysteine--tRNA ligase [Chloroflexota bacterium]